MPSPCFVLEEELLERNLRILATVQKKSGAKILLALKAFAMFSSFEMIKQYLSGAAASGCNEARLAREEIGLEVHSFSPCIKEQDFDQLALLSDYLIFNSLSQWETFRRKAALHPQTHFGIRINPEHSEVPTTLYNPCAPKSRLGVTIEEMRAKNLQGLTGLHFHTLCEQGFSPLARTVCAFEKKFGKYLHQMKWVNFGGGHHITKPGYDIDGLISLLIRFQKQYKVQVYLEPGEAISYQSGTLVGEVVDVVKNGINIAILDISATAHTPDVLEMPYRPEVVEGHRFGEKKYNYRLAGSSCLAGDIIGDYSFDTPLAIGQRIVFDDMIHYTMVKTNTFNGVPLPSIAIWKKNNTLQIVKQFGYQDFKGRLS